MPEGGYAVYGVDGIGHGPDGTPSNEDRTLVDNGFAGCRAAGRAQPAAVRVHERRRHAARRVPRRCATRPKPALRNLSGSQRDFPGIYAKWGFRDSVNVQTRRYRPPTCPSTRE